MSEEKKDDLVTSAIETVFLAATPLGMIFALADAVTENKPERLLDAALDINLSSGELD